MGDASHTFESYYKRATSPLIVLQLLKDQVMYGYQISQAMQKQSDGRYTIAVRSEERRVGKECRL